MTPDHGATLTPETVGLSPVQQRVDDDLSVPLDSVVETIPATVILHRGVTTCTDQSTRNILVPDTQELYVTRFSVRTMRAFKPRLDRVSPLGL